MGGSGFTAFLTGGTGFVGRHVARELIRCGHHVRALVRDPKRASDLRRLGCQLIRGDITSGADVADGVRGCRAVVHLVGIIRERPPAATFQRVHVDGTAVVLEAAARAGVEQFIHMSALGATQEGTDYHRTKWLAEEKVRHSGLRHVIYRPSIIVGEGGEFLRLLLRTVRFLPLVPVLGDGCYRLQPVDVEDVSDAFVAALEREDLVDGCLELGGPHKLTYNRIVDITCEELGYRRGKIHIPVPWVRPLTRLASHWNLPAPIDDARLEMLLAENVISGEDPSLRELLGRPPTSFRAVVRRVSGKAEG